MSLPTATTTGTYSHTLLVLATVAYYSTLLPAAEYRARPKGALPVPTKRDARTKRIIQHFFP
uniref:Uncharacterized protein n=1 Tax=Arundo donax TaxID=35708 RepID=A0A0A9FK76_ARUDO